MPWSCFGRCRRQCAGSLAFASLSLHYRVRDLTSYDVKFCLARLPVSIFGTVSGGHGGERLRAEFLDRFSSFSLRIPLFIAVSLRTDVVEALARCAV